MNAHWGPFTKDSSWAGLFPCRILQSNQPPFQRESFGGGQHTVNWNTQLWRREKLVHVQEALSGSDGDNTLFKAKITYPAQLSALEWKGRGAIYVGNCDGLPV